MVARCPIFSRTVRYFGPLSGIRMIVIPDNASVNIVQYFVQPTLTLSMSGIFERATCMATQLQLPATLTNHRLKVASRKQPLGLYSEFQPRISHCLLVQYEILSYFKLIIINVK